jgi:hypothetical protein
MGAVKQQMLEDMDKIGEALYEAGQYGLTYEVVLSTLLHMKNQPESSIEEALAAGKAEWDI